MLEDAARRLDEESSFTWERTTEPLARIAVTYHVGKHLVRLFGRLRVWNANVDGTDVPTSFATEAAAWEAGVREADRLDRFAAT